MKKLPKSASIPTLRRLPKYLHFLQKLQSTDEKFISATKIANEFGIEPILVRKDLSTTGIVGKPKIGFELERLIKSINEFLNWHSVQNAVIVGVGGLGKAIMGYVGFQDYGLNIVAAFDSDKTLIGKKIKDVQVFPINELPEIVKSNEATIGVITVPATSAQFICDVLVGSGIKGIWNFAPRALKVNNDVILENAQLSQSLAVLTHKMVTKNS